jgi:hypothetical protein
MPLPLTTVYGDTFDLERSAWTYRKVEQTDPYIASYAPLGVEEVIAKEKAKMTELWEDPKKPDIPISVVVYPWPAQIVHDAADSRQAQIRREVCQGRCKPFVSLFPAFLALKERYPRSQPGCWYLKDFIFGDAHYNATGNALAADAVIQSMTEAPPVKRFVRSDSDKAALRFQRARQRRPPVDSRNSFGADEARARQWNSR